MKDYKKMYYTTLAAKMLAEGQAASLSNTVADYASKINSLAHYIIDEPTSSSSEAQAYANDALDFIIPKLES